MVFSAIGFSLGDILFLFVTGCNTYKTRRKPSLKIHIRSHTGEKLLACPTCGAMFSTNTKYMDHCIRKKDIRGNSGFRGLYKPSAKPPS